MKTMRALAQSLVLAAALVACAGSIIPHATDQAAARFPGATRADLERGRELYVNRCSACHALIEPSRFPEEKWHKMVGEMAGRARLDLEDRDRVLHYLVAFARR